jgi:hypothetical protein
MGRLMRLAHSLWGRVLIGLAAIVFLVIVGAITLLYPTFFNLPPKAAFPQPSTQAEANTQDLKYLKEALHKVDRSFSPAASKEFD